MADEPRFNPNNMVKYEELFRELETMLSKISFFYRNLSPQEQELAGGIVVDVEFPWRGANIQVMMGPMYKVRQALDKLLYGWEVLRRQSGKPPDKEESGGGKVPLTN